MCRCRDTARIAFGEALLTDAALRVIATADRERTSAYERKAQSLIASPPWFVASCLCQSPTKR
jgi:hypothetical protein